MYTVLTRQALATELNGTDLVTVISAVQSVATTIGSPGPQGPKGDTGESSTTQTHSAGESLSGHRAIRVSSGVAYYCDGSNAAHIGRCIGITTGAALLGADATIQSGGLLTETSWNWAEGPVYVGSAGLLTQSLAGLAYIQQIGLAISPTAIDINPQLPILIS